MKLTYGTITTMNLTEVSEPEAIIQLLWEEEAYFVIRECTSDTKHSYKITKGFNGTRWLCVQVWNGEYLFNAGIDIKSKVFRCKPKWCGTDYIASGIPSSANKDINFFKKAWESLGNGLVPSTMALYQVTHTKKEYRLDD